MLWIQLWQKFFFVQETSPDANLHNIDISLQPQGWLYALTEDSPVSGILIGGGGGGGWGPLTSCFFCQAKIRSGDPQFLNWERL